MMRCEDKAYTSEEEFALKIVEEKMGEKGISLKRLEGGFTNSSFCVKTVRNTYVVRIPGTGTNEYINREDEIRNMDILSGTGLLPRIYYSDAFSGVIVSKYLEGNCPFNKEYLEDSMRLHDLCEVLVSLHKSGKRLSNQFDILAIQYRYRQTLVRMGVTLPDEVLKEEQRLRRAADYLFHRFPKELVSCHCDPKLNNFLYCENRLYLIDWEYSGMADKYFDLVNLIMTNGLDEEQEKQCLCMYESCDRGSIVMEKYLLYKVITDYLWLYWHLIKLHQGQMVEYNNSSWKKRLNRALSNLELSGVQV